MAGAEAAAGRRCERHRADGCPAVVVLVPFLTRPLASADASAVVRLPRRDRGRERQRDRGGVRLRAVVQPRHAHLAEYRVVASELVIERQIQARHARPRRADAGVRASRPTPRTTGRPLPSAGGSAIAGDDEVGAVTGAARSAVGATRAASEQLPHTSRRLSAAPVRVRAEDIAPSTHVHSFAERASSRGDRRLPTRTPLTIDGRRPRRRE